MWSPIWESQKLLGFDPGSTREAARHSSGIGVGPQVTRRALRLPFLLKTIGFGEN